MLAAELRSKIDKLWDLFWSGGIANPLTAIEQISYLIFMKRLDEADNKRKADAEWLKRPYISLFKGHEECRWSDWKHREGGEMLKHVRDKVFHFIQNFQGNGTNGGVSTFAKQMKDAVFIIPKPSLLVEAVEVLDSLKITEQNQDTQGDIYEYLLSELQASGKNGQFRTPRHIIKMMVALVNPKLGQTICDPACGTGGFLIGAYQHLLRTHTSQGKITIEADGTEHGLVGDKITDPKVWDFLNKKTFYGFDFDSTMLRIAAMNLVLHGIEQANIEYKDTLSKSFQEAERYNIVLANPPFKGSIDKGDIHEALSRTVKTTKTELLFVVQMMRLLVNGGRCAVIVPDGVLFGTSNAHQAVRRKLIEECQLEAVISMPSGVFKPYAGVSTAVMVFTKGGETDKVWFYDMQADGFSLDDKRERIKDNDIPDIIEKWNQRHKLKEPKKGDKWLWVNKKEIIANKYDLSISRYKPIEYEEVQYEDPKVIMDRILKLEEEIAKDVTDIRGMVE
jgi:type I restriction enzyme M protein